MTNKILCKNCYLSKVKHIFNKPYVDCPIYFKNDLHWTEMIYRPMTNLEYLEYLYEKKGEEKQCIKNC